MSERLDLVRARIERAARRSGRSPDAVTLVAVVKQVPLDAIRAAVASGVRDLGENRVQEADGHVAGIGRDAVRWHMIGHLQRNKAGRAVDLFDRIHSVDDRELAQALSRRAEALGRVVPVLVEVNVAGEATKFGVAPAELPVLLAEIAALPGLALEGLMTVGPAVDAEEARPGFVRLRELRDRAERDLGRALPELSMGMSGDYDVAIEEGATMVRVGSALFGART